jgi:hypothetical protein
MIDELRPLSARGFLHPALWLVGPTLVVALLLLPFALSKTGSGGPGGLAIAGAICLGAGGMAEVVAWSVRGRVAPWGLMLVGMAIRLAPPMALCIALLANRQGGRQHLAFIAYLLVFYLVTLGVETYLAVRRLAQPTADLKHSAR